MSSILINDLWIVLYELKKITKKKSCLELSESYDPTNPERSQRFLKDSDSFGQVES